MTLIKFDCDAFFDKKCTALLWFASGFVRETYCGAFCQTRCNSAKRTAFFTVKVPQSLDCSALQDSALSGIALKCGAHGGISVAHGMPR